MGTEQSVTDFLAEQWDPQLTLRQWWACLGASGLAFPTWPRQWHGRDWPRRDLGACSQAFAAAGAIGAPTGLGTLMGGPVVLHHGNDDQRRRLLPPLVNGTEGWCQLFSEPGAGSDLASVSTRAVRDGDEWVITGQKVWTSGAQHSARGMLVARTDADQPKHRGLTYFIIDMQQPGVDIRPIKQMNAKSHFNEVFFTEARVSDADRISDVNGGWAVTLATLAYERAGLSAADGVSGVRPAAGEQAGLLDQEVGALIEHARATAVTLALRSSAPLQCSPGLPTPSGRDPAVVADDAGGQFSLLTQLARELGRSHDPSVRQQVAEAYARQRIAGFTQQRGAANSRAGRAAGPEASLAKLFWTEGLQRDRDLGTAVLGASGMLTGASTPGGGCVQHFALTIPSARIAGGSDEIQHNIIAQRVLGLPKDVGIDAEVPFRELRRS